MQCSFHVRIRFTLEMPIDAFMGMLLSGIHYEIKFWNSSQVIIQEQRMGMVLTHGSNAWDGIMQCSFYIRIRFTHDITGFIDK